MSKQPPAQDQRAPQQATSRPAEQNKQQTTQHASGTASTTAVDQATRADAKQRPAMQKAEQKVTAGRAGERNITVEWIPVPIDNSVSARFNCKTLPGNTLEVTIEQLFYKTAYSGQGAVATTFVPVAPIGTKCKLTVRDVTTGEILEQIGTWRPLGSGGLWAFIKRLVGFS
jgi:hypothetical protein